MLDGRRTLPSFFLFAMVECDVIGCGKGFVWEIASRCNVARSVVPVATVCKQEEFLDTILASVHSTRILLLILRTRVLD